MWPPGKVGVNISSRWLLKAGELPPAFAEKLAALWGSSEAFPALKKVFVVVPIFRLLKKASREASWGGSLYFLRISGCSPGEYSSYSSYSSTVGYTRIEKLDKLERSSRVYRIELSALGSLRKWDRRRRLGTVNWIYWRILLQKGLYSSINRKE